jgi:hypothetical protein
MDFLRAYIEALKLKIWHVSSKKKKYTLMFHSIPSSTYYTKSWFMCLVKKLKLKTLVDFDCSHEVSKFCFIKG